MPIRPASPPFGFSTLTTSAPIQASASVQVVPASNWVRSRTLMPARQFGGTVVPSICLLLPIRGAERAHLAKPSNASVEALLLHDPLHRGSRHHPIEVRGNIGRQFHVEPLCRPE